MVNMTTEMSEVNPDPGQDQDLIPANELSVEKFSADLVLVQDLPPDQGQDPDLEVVRDLDLGVIRDLVPGDVHDQDPGPNLVRGLGRKRSHQLRQRAHPPRKLKNLRY